MPHPPSPKTRSNATRTLINLPLELQDFVFSYLTIIDVIAWRNCGRIQYRTVTIFLQRRLHVLLAPFVPYPMSFLDELFRYRALIGGLIALAFMIMDQDLHFPVLEVYAPDVFYPALVTAVEAIVHDNLAMTTVVSTVNATSIREIVEATTFRMTNGRALVIYRSSTWSPLLPICRSPTSLLFNYVSRTSFGCAYPTLTLRHRGLLADMALHHALPQDLYAMNTVTEHGFDISWAPARFAKEDRIAQRLRVLNPTISLDVAVGIIASELRPNFTDRPATHARRFRTAWGAPPFHARTGWSFFQGTQPCFSSRGMCPQQVRFFGDASSFIDFLDPLSTDREELEEKCMAPFGTLVAWKLCSSYRCGGVTKCGPILPREMLLEDGVVHLPALSGRNRFDRSIARHHPPIYLYHMY